MSKKKANKNKEFVNPRQELRESYRITPKELLGGSVLTREVVMRQIPFALFLFAMLLFYIGNQYRGDKIMREIMMLESRVKELRAESAMLSFERQEISKQSEVVRLLKNQGLDLKEALAPPYKIILDD